MPAARLELLSHSHREPLRRHWQRQHADVAACAGTPSNGLPWQLPHGRNKPSASVQNVAHLQPLLLLASAGAVHGVCAWRHHGWALSRRPIPSCSYFLSIASPTGSACAFHIHRLDGELEVVRGCTFTADIERCRSGLMAISAMSFFTIERPNEL
jgi:hypothetical protein